jgi:sporulation protein YlmC with PRC-barrel domain
MLHKVKDLQGDAIVAADGEIGAVNDLYFDDERWAVRYVVVDTRRWIPGRKILISPVNIDREHPLEEGMHVHLTREQIKKCPDMEAHKPVSRQYEMAHARHFGYPYYWIGPDLWGPAPYPVSVQAAREKRATSARAMQEHAEQERAANDSHLRSSSEVIGYGIEATDGEIGRVADLVMDDETWAITDVLVDTRTWLPGKLVLVSPKVIERIDWPEKKVKLRLAREEIMSAPEVMI